MKRFAPVIALILLGLSTLACVYLDDWGVTAVPPDAPKNSDIRFTFTGPGTNTWGWGGLGNLPCATQDDMTLTIDYANNAKLNSRGVCFFTRFEPDQACNSHTSDLPCGVVILGMYNPVDQKITWNSCNGAGNNYGSGSATMFGNITAETNLQISGNAFCLFPNFDENYSLQFTLFQSLPAQAP